ncbi:MAG: sulfotransferase [Geminicoccaceae bacterium]
MSTPRAHPTRDRSRAKLPLVYLLSTGRSGSTLLDVLLGAQPECWTLGEFQLLDIGVGRQAPCGCHSPLGQCDFWEPILERMRRSMRFPIGHFRSGRHPNGKVVRWSLLPSILTGGPLPTQRSAADAYATSNLRAIEEAKEAAENRQDEVAWLIDASKDPYRLLWLQASGHFDIRVIHLVRRPEGFVANMMRSAGSRSTGAAVKYAGRWLVDNLIGTALLWRMFWPDAVKRVRYEDLATDPERTLGEICHWLGVSFDPDRTQTTRYDVNHGVAGNRPRWEALPVTFEENWRATMPPLQRRLISLVTAPLARLWNSRRAPERSWNTNGNAMSRDAVPPWMTRSSS